MPNQAKRTSTSDEVFRKLRSAIQSGELQQGSLHSIYEFAETYQVSRTPVREAVLRLADTGMVVIERNRGFRIRGLTVDDVRAVFEFRLVLETTSSSYAAQHASPSAVERLVENLMEMPRSIAAEDTESFTRLDREFHDEIIATMDNSRVRRELAGLRAATQAMGVTTMDRTSRLREIYSDHQPIVKAIAAGDSLAAARAMTNHLVHSGCVIMSEVSVRTGDPMPVNWPDFLLPSLLNNGEPDSEVLV
ncbi:MAG: GntR family transcriptional regulator [Mycobacterium sp.]